jgi:hypothetical protein
MAPGGSFHAFIEIAGCGQAQVQLAERITLSPLETGRIDGLAPHVGLNWPS